MKRPFLVNAQQMALEHPKTFDAPPSTDGIRAGDHVKVCDHRERFWVQITSRDGDILRGTVDNKLLFHDMRLGDEIEFAIANVYDWICASHK